MLRRLGLCSIALIALAFFLPAQDFNPKLFSALKWRLVGPFRGGRVTAVTGVPGQPNTFLFGTPGGGVWRTTDAGRVWQPIADTIPFSSIGAMAVAPSDPKIIYLGTGEQIAGIGMFKSTDGGASWSSIGLAASRFIQSIIVDPRNPNIVVVGANDAGSSIIWPNQEKSPYSAGAGIFRTTDGGRTWTKAFAQSGSVGVVDMCAEPSNPRVLYASFYTRSSGTGDSAVAATSAIFKSTDEGATWKPLVGKGLPAKALGRLGIAVAPASRGRLLYVIVNQGLFRSDDSGLTWQRSTSDPRIVGSEYFSRVFVDPRNPDTLYLAQTSLYRSTDGGKKFQAFAGAPSGDDFHLVWIDPADSSHIFLGVDQGAIVSLDGGLTWSSWDNQPTGQFYHVITDATYPYRIYASQQDSGTTAILSRSDNGQIGVSDWYSVAGFEYCHIAPDPLNPNIVYSGAWYGSVIRFDKSTGQSATVFVRGTKYEGASMAPLLFLPHDPHALLLGTQYVLKTIDAGQTWREISPDLTALPAKPDAPESKPAEKPYITALAVSPIAPGQIWAGTSNRLVQLTRDNGYSWTNVSPTGLPERASIRMIEPGHHDPAVAFAVAGARHEVVAPFIARTHDFGRTWQPITHGLPDADEVYVVREDPIRKGLLYSGTANGVYVSFDDGDHWETLQLNLPHTPVTDLTVRDSDLVASTFGRALWVLDDVTPLRQSGAQMTSAPAYLLQPADAIRTHWDTYQDTPSTPETPAGKNPPDGTVIDYYLKVGRLDEVTLSIYDSNDKLIRAYSSTPSSKALLPANVPDYWFAPEEILPRATGLNRFVWDLRYPPPETLPFGYYGKLLEYTEYTLADHAIPGETPRHQPLGALVLPGTYTLELTVGGHKYRQALNVKLDPRVSISAADLTAQSQLLRRIDTGMSASFQGFQQAESLRVALHAQLLKVAKEKEAADALRALEKSIDEVQNGVDAAPGFGPINRDLARYTAALLNADGRPSEPIITAVHDACQALDASLVKWRQLNEKVPAPLAKADVAAPPACHY